MPHFYENAEDAYKLIKKIPEEKVIMLDKDLALTPSGYTAVFQDFQNDITEALETALNLLKKYDKLILVHPIIIPMLLLEVALSIFKFCICKTNFCQCYIN